MAFYVGGSESELEFDFYTKIANSVVDCPLKIYTADIDVTALPEPTNAIWQEILTQADIDKLKQQDNINLSKQTATTGKASAFLVECDLTPIATALYGGSNSALKSAITKFEISAWAMGYGANVNQLEYGCGMSMWGGSSWFALNLYQNTTNAISKLAYSPVGSTAQNKLMSTNKIYLIISSQYTSDGTIASEVNLDYVNIKVKLARISDVITPTQVTLSDAWSMLLKGVSPSWDSTKTGQLLTLLAIHKDVNNRFSLYWHNTSNVFRIKKVIDGISFEYSINVGTFQKFNIKNFLFGFDKNSGIFIYGLNNNGSIVKNTGTSKTTAIGLFNIYIGHSYGNDLQADSFLDNLYFFNNKTFTDEEAEVLLRGRNTIVGKENDANLNQLAAMFKNPNLIPLFNDSRWIKHANTTVSSDGKTLTLNATSAWQQNSIILPILPNNQYELKFNKTGFTGHLSAYELCGNYQVEMPLYRIGFNTDGIYSSIITTHSKTNNIKIVLTASSTTANTYTWSNIELRRLD